MSSLIFLSRWVNSFCIHRNLLWYRVTWKFTASQSLQSRRRRKKRTCNWRAPRSSGPGCPGAEELPHKQHPLHCSSPAAGCCWVLDLADLWNKKGNLLASGKCWDHLQKAANVSHTWGCENYLVFEFWVIGYQLDALPEVTAPITGEDNRVGCVDVEAGGGAKQS